ncbi:hypothetical protein NX774_08000 [Massilia agilis]|uniref:MSHA biogenesis protein MshK n=1 Tax=Massilia agilis TaxID=1811226 RepID=A0ABT2D9B0_9BURK|nr:hypothetical protein [Massilia agilis]MCS0807864.1 hypothetical protein [Massilia agilis]
MAEALIFARHLVAGAALSLVVAFAHAQSLQDPTRPPVLSTAGDAGAVATGPQLQSVLISRQPGGRHVAVIDGDTVRLGDQYKGARVTRIKQNEVELVRGKEHQVLKLTTADETDGAVTPVARRR